MIDIENLKVNFENKVLSSDKIIIVPHKNADFDAIGSSLGLSLASKKLKKDSIIIVDDKTYELDRGVQYIIKEAKNEYPIKSKCKYQSDASKDDLFVLTDVNKNYLITCNDLLTNPEKVIVIDHHEDDENTVKSNNLYIDPKISSASEIVSKMLLKMKIKIPKNIANYLLAGIYLDTNKLTKNVSSDTLLIASKLLEQGAQTNEVLDLFVEDFDSDRRVQELVNRTKMITYKIALVLADEKEEYTTKEIARTADNGLTYGCDASFAVAKIDDDTIAISARSKEKIDCGKIMSEFKGGGNQFSGAARIKDLSIDEVGNKLVKLLRPNYYIEKTETN